MEKILSQKPPLNCPDCGGAITERKGKQKETGKFYHFWGCSNFPKCKYTWRPYKVKISKEAVAEQIIIKKLNQILFLLTGFHPENHREQFEKILKENLGKGLFKKNNKVDI